MLPAHRHDERLLVGAVGLSAGGDFLALIPLVAAVQASSGSGLVVAAFFVALWAPLVILAPLAGRIVDSFETSRVLALSSLLQALVVVAIIPVSDSDPATIALIALLGCANAIAQAAEFSLVPAVAAPGRIKILNGHVETARYLGMTVGPLLGGLLGAAGGLSIALLLNALTFVVIAAAAMRLRVRRERRAAAAATSPGGGLRVLIGDPLLRLVMAVTFLTLLVMTGVAAAEVFFIREDLGGGDAGYGLLMSAWTIGMVAGALLLSRRVASGSLAAVALLMIVVQGAGIVAPTLWLWLPFAAPMYVLGGIGHGTKNVLVRTLIHERVAPAAHGRAGAAYNAIRNGAELGALATGGVLIELLGARTTLTVQGGIPVLIALVGLLYLLRRPPRDAGPQPAPAEHRQEVDEAIAEETLAPRPGPVGEDAG
jgi:predicted MFS family arabinose efflux permease